MIVSDYSIARSHPKRVLLINPPIYDTRYWDRWSQPYGLLRVASLLKNLGYRAELIDCLAPPHRVHGFKRACADESRSAMS
jgi:hypothetical protein